eukprot:GCRY01002570.1.p1 GENE.GCRY01002570.1~~GCRY01002570.1.p1  ORF type:complete len:449 (-),score=27.77 GCRY01002570.1:190-1410(-)
MNPKPCWLVFYLAVLSFSVAHSQYCFSPESLFTKKHGIPFVPRVSCESSPAPLLVLDEQSLSFLDCTSLIPHCRYCNETSCLHCDDDFELFEGPDGIIDCVCAQGAMQVDDHCELCPAGSFSDTFNAEVCTSCPAGKWSLKGSTTCELPCDPGYACRNGSRTPCGPGTFSIGNMAYCITCLDDTYSTDRVNIHCASCPDHSHISSAYPEFHDALKDCLCDVGYFFFISDCKLCLPGFYCENGTSCEICPSGTFSVPGSTSCSDCPPGEYSYGGFSRCDPCSPGEYSLRNASAWCDPCELGTYSDTPGSTECRNCPPGTFGPDWGMTVCTDCPPGEQQGLDGKSTCEKCDPGTISPSPHGVSCEFCAANTYAESSGLSACKDCDWGTYSVTGASICLTCTPEVPGCF